MGNKSVGKQIQKYRKKAGLSQEELAEKIDLTTASISNIERGVFYPKMENFIDIANLLGVSADLLLCDVIHASQPAKENELSERLKNVSQEKRRQIYRLIETMLEEDE